MARLVGIKAGYVISPWLIEKDTKKLYEKGICILRSTLLVKSFLIYGFVTITTTL